jgi:hypothetical protein
LDLLARKGRSIARTDNARDDIFQPPEEVRDWDSVRAFSPATPPNNTGNIITLVVILSLVLLPAAWPVSPYFIVASALWWFLKDRESPFYRAIVNVLMPSLVGLFLLCLLVIFVNLFSHMVTDDELATLEVKVAWLFGVLRQGNEWVEPPTNVEDLTRLLVFIPLVTAIIISEYLLPRWEPISRFLGLKRMLSFLLILLATLSGFTFFSRYPALAWRDHARAYVTTKTAELEEQERNSIARVAATESFKCAIDSSISDLAGRARVSRLVELASIIDEETLTAANVEYRPEALSEAAKTFVQDVRASLGIEKFLKQKASPPSNPPATRTYDDLLSALQRVKQQRLKALEAERLEAEIKELMINIVSSITSSVRFGALYSQTVDILIGKIIEGLDETVFKELSADLPNAASKPEESAQERARSISIPSELVKDLLDQERPLNFTESKIFSITEYERKLTTYRGRIQLSIELAKERKGLYPGWTPSKGQGKDTKDQIRKYLAREKAQEARRREITQRPLGEKARSSFAQWEAESPERPMRNVERSPEIRFERSPEIRFEHAP